MRRKTTKFTCLRCGNTEIGGVGSKYCFDCKYEVMRERNNANKKKKSGII